MALSSTNSEESKLFVGGLSNVVTDETLAEYFQKYGEVVEAVAMKDQVTGFSRGFGFVRFTDAAAVGKALKEEKHVIMENTVEVKRAFPRKDQHHSRRNQYPNQTQQPNGGVSNSGAVGNDESRPRSKKIFVGGLPANLTEGEFKEYFEKFGITTDVAVIYDSQTRRPRGFGFITFDSEEAVDDALKSNFHMLKDKAVEVKIAVPKNGYSYSNGGNLGGNNHSSRTGGRRDFVYNSHHGYSPPYSPNYVGFNGFMPFPYNGNGYNTSSLMGGYPIGGYAGLGYGVPFRNQGNHWINPHTVYQAYRPMPYSNNEVYPDYVSTGFGVYRGLANGGQNGAVYGNPNQDATESPNTAESVVNSNPVQVNDSDPSQVNDSDPSQVNDSDPSQVNDSDPSQVNDSDPSQVESKEDAH